MTTLDPTARPKAQVLIRPSTEADMAAVTEIYGHHVAHGLASFEEEPPTRADMTERRANLVARGMPYLVAEAPDGTILGYAYAGPYRPRPAYRYSVEDSVYVAPQATGRGIGAALLAALVPLCREAGFRQMMAVIGDSGNEGSIRLHRAFGFREVGVLEGIGFKFGRPVDVVLMQLSLIDA